MGELGIFFREDIRNMLLAIDEANLDIVKRHHEPEVRIYRLGFAAALKSVALSFGVFLTAGEVVSPQIDICDKHGTFVARFPPAELGTEIQTR